MNHDLISPKLKRLAFSQEYVIRYEIGFGIGFGFWICYEIGFGFDLDLGLDLKNHSGYL